MLNVLVVDDSLVIRAMTANLLQKDRGLNVIGAVASTMEAAEMLSKYIVDVVTLDIEMPGGSGLDYLDVLVRRKVPVVMLSGKTGEGSPVRAEALARGASACFDKANAVRNADDLIQLVKDAGNRRVRLSASDLAARDGKANVSDAASSSAPSEQRYFFHVVAASQSRDDTGTLFPTREAAVAHGHSLLQNAVGEALTTGDAEIRAGIAVMDQNGAHVASVTSVTRTVFADA